VPAAERAGADEWQQPAVAADPWDQPVADTWPAIATEAWPEPTDAGWPDATTQPTWSDSPATTTFAGQADASDASAGGAAFTGGTEPNRPISSGVFGRFAAPDHGLGAKAGAQGADASSAAAASSSRRTAPATDSNLWQLVDEPAASSASAPAERRGFDPVTVFLTVLVAVIIVALLVGFLVMLGQAF
jgi:hypothetical protein